MSTTATATWVWRNTLEQLASSLNMSMRQVGRDAKDLSTAFGGGYRDALLVVRLMAARSR